MASRGDATCGSSVVSVGVTRVESHALGNSWRRRWQAVLKTLQTYSDGTIVRWIDDTAAGQPEPEHPAPVLTLTAAGCRRGR
jgi:hypothetical protein